MGEKRKPVLSISILISNNRADTIEKCMKSLVPLREAIPSELIIVDTGCKDKGIEIARQYADKVVEFTWCNDFAAARNAGLNECTGEWFLYMDDDEWFEDVSELIDFFQEKERNRYDALWYIVRNYDNCRGTAYTDSFVGRVVRLTPESKFYGKIHEWIEPVPVKMKRVSSYAHHYGYVYKNEEERQMHLERNISLEEAAVAEHPEDIRMCCQLVQEYRAADRFDDAEILCKKTLEETNYLPINSFVQYLIVTLPKIYREQKKFEKSLEEFERLEKEEQLLHQTKRALYFEKAVLFGKMEQHAKVAEECKKYFEECKVLPKEGEPVEYEVMDFVHYTSEGSTRKMIEYGILGVVHGKAYEYAEYFFDMVDWSEKAPYPYEQLSFLLGVYRESGKKELLIRYLPKIVEQPELEYRLYGSLHNLYASHPENRTQLLEDLEATGIRSGNFPYFHLLYLAQRNALTTVDVAEYYEKSDRKYDAEALVLLFDKPELLQVALEHTDLELYQEAVGMFAKELTIENSDKLVKDFVSGGKIYPEEKRSFFLYGKMQLADQLLRVYVAREQTEGREPDSKQVRELLWQVVVTATEYCEYMYHPAALAMEGQWMLPKNCRFAYRIKTAFENEGAVSVWAGAVKDAAQICPELLPAFRVLLAEKETQSHVPNPEEELQQLATTLKATIRTQLAEGKKEEAKALLLELRELLPRDEEVVELLAETEK